MPRFEIDSERALALATALVYVSSCVIEDFKHRHKSIAVSICASNVAVTRSNAVNSKTDTASELADYRALLKSIIDPIY
jgi:hypothetical protein